MILDNDDPHLFTKMELNDVVRDLGLSKSSAELLASKLQEKNPSLTVLVSPSTATDIKSTSGFFLRREGLGVLYGCCTASAQAWSATVPTRRLESVH